MNPLRRANKKGSREQKRKYLRFQKHKAKIRRSQREQQEKEALKNKKPIPINYVEIEEIKEVKESSSKEIKVKGFNLASFNSKSVNDKEVKENKVVKIPTSSSCSTFNRAAWGITDGKRTS